MGSNGKPFAGAQVSWSVLSGGGSVTPATSTTSADGVAQTQWTLGTRFDAPHVARAVASAVSPVEFTATPTLPPSAVIERSAGDAQQQAVDNLLTDSLVATVKLADGRAVEGATVTWTVGATAGSVSPTSTLSRSTGIAKTSLRLGTAAGAVTVTASVSGLTPATFNAVAVPGPVETVAIDAQTKVLAGSTAQLTARLADRFGNVITNKTPAWRSNSDQVATVSASGLVTGVRAGRTTIVATADGKSASGLVGVIARLGFGTPTMDGIIGSTEWANAATFPVDVALPGGGTTPGTIYAMNDGSNLYVALRYQRTIDDPAKGVSFEFDNNGNGLFGSTGTEEGDDIIGLNGGSPFMDVYRTYQPPCPVQGPCGFFDTDDGGAVNGSGGYAFDGTFHTFELSHPLRSGDAAHDFSLNAGDDVGMSTDIRIIGTGGRFPQDFGDTRWPLGGYLYMRIAAAP
jgi:hypothetical protein